MTIGISMPPLPAHKGPSPKASRDWANRQTQNMDVVAADPSQPESVLLDIVNHAPARLVGRVASNPGTSSAVLDRIWDYRATFAIAKKLAAHANASPQLLSLIKDSTYGYETTCIILARNRNTPLTVLTDLLPISFTVGSPRTFSIPRWSETKLYRTILTRPDVPVEAYLQNSWYLPVEVHMDVLRKRRKEVEAYIARQHNAKLDLAKNPLAFMRVIKKHYRPV